MNKGLVLLLLAAVLGGCDMASNMAEFGEKQEQVGKLMQERHGWDAQVGWQTHNGTLTQVTVLMKAEQVAETPVGQVQAAVREIVQESFDETPQYIALQLLMPGKQAAE